MLVAFLVPSCFYKYFFVHGIYPWNDFLLGVKFSMSIFCVVMAYWSHSKASPPYDPGYLNLDHFRNDK